MCGIIGFASTCSTLAPKQLRVMRDALVHRGPDGAGQAGWDGAGKPVSDDTPARVALAHRRLSIIDLSDAAAQPMANEDETVWITYNGEFYNFEDFRDSLEQRGHRFRSHSDTETILHLYEERGFAATLEQMNGMFAFALWDAAKQRLWLARDRMGQKPLYYVHQADGTLIFASEIKALIAGGYVNQADVDPVAIDQFWTFGYILGERTLYRGVRRLLPGHYACWQAGRLHTQAYWSFEMGTDVAAEAELDDLADELEALLQDAIRLRLIADVPLGLFLSGGIDSSLICALAGRVAGDTLRTFTIAFNQASFDEAPYAREVARHLKLPNTVLTVDEDHEAAFPDIARQFDEPFGDVSCIPTYYVCKLTRQVATVALSGDAGDELFAGYDDYRNGLRIWGNPDQRAALRVPRTPRQRLSDARLRLAGPGTGFCLWARHLNRRQRRKLYQPAFRDTIDFDQTLAARMQYAGSGGDPLSRMQHIDAHTYLPDDILTKVDRMSMMVSLECRSPFLDHRVVAFAARLPLHTKMDAGGNGKVILRHLLKRYMPQKLFDRPKTGFTPPWQHWCTGALRDQLHRAWQSAGQAYYQPGAARWVFPEEEKGTGLPAWNGYAHLALLDKTLFDRE